MGCRGVAVLPEQMSAERFEWLDRWVADPSDIIRTPGSESNVKEIYDRCHELAGPRQRHLEPVLRVREPLGPPAGDRSGARADRRAPHGLAARSQVRAFVSATGSAGTIGAGDHLKERFGSITVAVEALECPTLLNNGYGEHNIQGIGDKHVPLIHNVMATDVVVAVSDRATDSLNVLANTDVGRRHLASRRRAVRTDRRPRVLRSLQRCNVSRPSSWPSTSARQR